VSPAAAELRRQAIRDAALVGAGVWLVWEFLEKATEAARVDDAERALIYARQAGNELEALRLTLRDHFDRLGCPPSGELNRAPKRG